MHPQQEEATHEAIHRVDGDRGRTDHGVRGERRAAARPGTEQRIRVPVGLAERISHDALPVTVHPRRRGR